jgi:hypothetical protein
MRASILLFSWMAVSAPAGAQATNESCAVIVPGESGTEETIHVPEFIVTGTPSFRLPAGYENATAVICGRDELRIRDDDYRVLVEGGVPLFVISGDRMLIFQMENGQFYVEFEGGELSDDEGERIQSALDRAQENSQQSD